MLHSYGLLRGKAGSRLSGNNRAAAAPLGDVVIERPFAAGSIRDVDL